MPYEINFTDQVNKGALFVEDSTINTETSISIPGKFTTGYGQAIGTSLLHLLENFASPTSPDRPVEGQLWYDTTSGVDQLKIYDGTTWSAAGGLKKSTNEPAVSNSVPGDLWVNTESQQLYLFTGSTWVLVGPDFSDGLFTGADSQIVFGTDDIEYNILSLKIQNKIAAILSSKTFVPKSTIEGFRQGIKAGINLSSTPLFSDLGKYYGISEKAEALVINNETIPASKFLRADQISTSDFQLKIKNDLGIQLGSSGNFNLQVSGTTGVISNNTQGSNIDFRLRTETGIQTVLRVDSSQKVGINNVAPDEELDVIGNIQITPKADDPTSGVLKIDSVLNSTSIDDGSIVTNGGIGIAQNANIGGNVEIGGALTTTNITPDTGATRNIGTPLVKFDQMYANTFIGNVQGNVSGTVTGRAGSADRLASATTFQISGDVEDASFAFDGQTGGSTKTFNVSIKNSFVSNKQSISVSDDTDEILLSNSTGLYRIRKGNFLRSIPTNPVGSIVAYGGIRAPSGWVFCDGSEVLKSDFNELWQTIGHSFKDPQTMTNSSVTHFTLPDMRGRMPLGLDNMNGSSASRVIDPAASELGSSSGNEFTTVEVNNLPEHEHNLEGESGTQYYSVRTASGVPIDNNAINLTIEPGEGGTQGLPSSGGIRGGGITGNNDWTNQLDPVTGEIVEQNGAPLDTMNPFLSVNYIIYTGN